MARKIIAANWKENPKTAAAAMRLFEASMRAAADVYKIGKGKVVTVICPPPLFLEDISRAFVALKKKRPAGFALGAQDVFWEERGAFTGGTGPKMLRSLGVHYVIVGHSERRKWFNETDAMVNKKVLQVTKDGLHAILCVGEPLSVREKGIAAAKRYLKSQLAYDLKKVFDGDVKGIIIAYEPIWAIGSGHNDNPDDAATIAAFIKATVRSIAAKTVRKGKVVAEIKVRVLYGGSVNSRNVADYVQLKDVDGALVGGASLRADEFEKLMRSAVKSRTGYAVNK